MVESAENWYLFGNRGHSGMAAIEDAWLYRQYRNRRRMKFFGSALSGAVEAVIQD
jgi:hypothetical protein